MEEDSEQFAAVAAIGAVSNLFTPCEGAKAESVYYDASARCYVVIYRRTGVLSIIKRVDEYQKGYSVVDLKWDAVSNFMKIVKSMLLRFDDEEKKKEEFWESHKIDESVTVEFTTNDSRCRGKRRLLFVPSNPSPLKTDRENLPYLIFEDGTDFHFLTFMQSNMVAMLTDAKEALLKKTDDYDANGRPAAAADDGADEEGDRLTIDADEDNETTENDESAILSFAAPIE